MKQYTTIITLSILIFHIGITLFGFYTMFTDFSDFTIFHFVPFMYLLYAICWFGVYCRNKIAALAYIFLSMIEIGIKIIMSKTIYSEVFGDLLFPVNLLFIFIILILYKQLFHNLESEKNNSK